MIPTILKGVLGALGFGGEGALSAVTNGAKAVAIAAAAPLAWNWFQGHGNDVVVTLSVSQVLLCGGFVYALLAVAHAARGP